VEHEKKPRCEDRGEGSPDTTNEFLAHLGCATARMKDKRKKRAEEGGEKPISLIERGRKGVRDGYGERVSSGTTNVKVSRYVR